jgi:hypothetical protein
MGEVQKSDRCVKMGVKTEGGTAARLNENRKHALVSLSTA